MACVDCREWVERRHEPPFRRLGPILLSRKKNTLWSRSKRYEGGHIHHRSTAGGRSALLRFTVLTGTGRERQKRLSVLEVTGVYAANRTGSSAAGRWRGDRFRYRQWLDHCNRALGRLRTPRPGDRSNRRPDGCASHSEIGHSLCGERLEHCQK